MTEPLKQHALRLLQIYKLIYFFFTSLLFTDLFNLAVKAEQPHKAFILLATLSGPAKRNRYISVEGNILLCNDDKEGWTGQRWDEPLTPSEPAECAGDHRADDEVVDPWTVHLVSLAGQQTDVSLTRSALISWPVGAGNHRGHVVSVDHWVWSKLAHKAWKPAGHSLSGIPWRTYSNTLFKTPM